MGYQSTMPQNSRPSCFNPVFIPFALMPHKLLWRLPHPWRPVPQHLLEVLPAVLRLGATWNALRMHCKPGMRTVGVLHPPPLISPHPGATLGMPPPSTSANPAGRATPQVLPTYCEFGVRMVGICFGHQILARALGGTVGKNPSGR
eukprot:364311-Chlamydomonas_euryale.AAC.5